MTRLNGTPGGGDRAAAPVLVTDGEQRSALAVVRSLGRAGHPVYVCSSRSRSLAGSSRYARGQAVTPDPLTDPAGYVEALLGLVRRWGIRVLVPVAEPALLAVLDARARFAGVEVPFPDAATFRAVCDKAAVLEMASELGIAIPAQWTVASAADVERLDPDRLPYPIVLKPSRSVSEDASGRVKLGVGYAMNPAELRNAVAALPRAAFPVLLQQRVVGPGIGIFLLVRDGAVLASFAHRRIREKPPSGGVSVYRESAPADPALVRLSQALLGRFGWTGVAMVEYKVDAATGTPYLMEINGRFWGSLQLAVDAGVDFPRLLVDAAMGHAVAPSGDYRIGVRSRWWWGDVDQVLTLLRRSPAELALPPDAPSRWRSLLDFFVLWRPGDRNEIFRWTDPRPLLRESIDWLARR